MLLPVGVVLVAAHVGEIPLDGLDEKRPRATGRVNQPLAGDAAVVADAVHDVVDHRLWRIELPEGFPRLGVEIPLVEIAEQVALDIAEIEPQDVEKHLRDRAAEPIPRRLADALNAVSTLGDRRELTNAGVMLCCELFGVAVSPPDENIVLKQPLDQLVLHIVDYVVCGDRKRIKIDCLTKPFQPADVAGHPLIFVRRPCKEVMILRCSRQ